MIKKTSPEELALAFQLRGAGIPLDAEVLKAMEAACRGLAIYQDPIIISTGIFDLYSGGTGYMLSIFIHNDAPRNVWLHEFRLEIPWWEPEFRWLEDPMRKVPREYIYSLPPPGVEGFDRDVVLNHRLRRNGRISPDGWLEGLLLGVGQEPMPSGYRDRQTLNMRLSVFDERGNRFEADIKFLVDRHALRIREKKLAQHKPAQRRYRGSRSGAAEKVC